MLKLSRPAKPSTFDSESRSAEQDVQHAIRKCKKPTFDNEVWRHFKDDFVECQHGRCAYCERRLSDTGQLEHFRPRSRITQLYDDPGTWGIEVRGLRTEGRKFRIISALGYHWLAYSWDNFNASCERCNNAKSSLFPIEDPAGRVLPPTKIDSAKEKPLLLDPYADIEPAKHLEFDSIGAVQAHDGSPHGWETVRSLALDRKSYRESRFDTAERAYACIHALYSGEEQAKEQALKDLLHLGRNEATASHPGMVRIIAEQELLMTWDELQALMA